MIYPILIVYLIWGRRTTLTNVSKHSEVLTLLLGIILLNTVRCYHYIFNIHRHILNGNTNTTAVTTTTTTTTTTVTTTTTTNNNDHYNSPIMNWGACESG